MDLMLLAPDQITLAVARSNSAKDHCVTGGMSAAGATSMGTAHTGQLFTLGVLK